MEGDFFSNSISFTTGEPSTFAITALEKTLVYRIHKDVLSEIYNNITEFEKVARILYEDALKTTMQDNLSFKTTNIVNPVPGIIVFDPVKEILCVYNGTQWSYWRYQ